jgi:hypothetical protein
MSLIPFPNVPKVPGVPDVPRSITNAVTGIYRALGGDLFGLMDLFSSTKWQILTAGGQPALTPDSVIGLEYKGDAKIATHPVENGSFSAYNKVAVPSDLHIVMTCGGMGQMTRAGFLIALEAMKNSLLLYSIVTPDATYPRMNLINYSYRRTAKNGVSMLTVEAAFQEVRESAVIGYYSTKTPAAQDNQGRGTVQATEVNVK